MASANNRPLRNRLLKGKTARERALRARALRSMELLRTNRGLAKSKMVALGKLLESSKSRHGIKGKPFLEMPSGEAVSYLDKKLLPSKLLRFDVGSRLAFRKIARERVMVKKDGLVKKLFESGLLGLFMIKPEMFAKQAAIKDFLKENGLEIVFNKAFVFSSEEIARLYPHVLGDRKKYGNTSVQFLSLLSSPSLVVVFSHPGASEYAKIAQKYGIKATINPGKNQQQAFVSVFKNYLRKKFTRAELVKNGFEKGNLAPSAKAIDALGFFEKNAMEKTDPLIAINGIHVPTEKEMKRDARTLLTLTELENLEKRIVKQKNQ